MSPLIYYLLAFGIYTISIILMTGQSFAWKETRSSFYLGAHRVGAFSSTATFCATWISPLSLVGYSMWMYHDGYIAFATSVNGWMLGFLFFPFIVRRLRSKRALSLPEWLEKSYGDSRVRKLVAVTMIFIYILYLVIQFKAFGVVVSYMLKIPEGFAATSLIYLFVLYTTFGGYVSVVKSDVFNLALILFGVTVAAYSIAPADISLSGVIDIFTMKGQDVSSEPISLLEMFSSFVVMLSWGLGVAGNPQYAIRIMACRNKRDAYRMLSVSPFVIGWVYIAVTFFILVCRANHVVIGNIEETMAFAKLGQLLPNFASASLLIAVIAAAVSTANSQLLLAASSLCYDCFPVKSNKTRDMNPIDEDRFLLTNRVAIAVIASIALALSGANLPGYLMLGRISWALVAICFFYPLFLPRMVVREVLFPVLCVAITLQFMLVFVAGLAPEYAVFVVLAVEAALFKFNNYFKSSDEDSMYHRWSKGNAA